MKSRVIIETLVTELPEGGSARSRHELVNSTGVSVAAETTFNTGVSSAASFSNPVNARVLLLFPPTTNTSPYRVSQSTAEVGLPFSSQGPAVLSISPSTVASTYYGWTTSTRAISGMRVLYL